MKRFPLCLVLLALFGAAFAAPPSAASLLDQAKSQASRERKNVLVIFHASWCGWCHRLDETFLADKEMGKLVNDSFVVLHLDVLEHGDKKSLENAGGEELMGQWGGKESGLPFLVVLNSKGTKLMDSNRTGDARSNIGYPAQPQEIGHFVKMLRTSARFKDLQAKKVEDWLTAHAPK